MADIDLESRFPELRPIRKAPTLFRVNGCGLGAYGRRDGDDETGTYVKTHALCVVFVPILALGAYRVADAPSGGWYFLGREPISPFARAWNLVFLMVACTLGGLVGWQSYTKTPGYVAARKMDEADALARSKQLARAADLYREVASGTTEHAQAATGRLKDLLGAPLDQAPPSEAAGVLKVAREAQQQGRAIPPGEIYTRGRALASRHAQDAPRDALAILDVVAPLAPEADGDAVEAARLALLERLVATNPGDPELASRLAEVHEAREQPEKCKALLMPLRDKLGLTEGARILGHILAREGDIEGSHALLLPYAEGRLARLHEAEGRLQGAVAAAQQRVVDALKKGNVTDFDYTALKEGGNEAEARARVRQYVDDKVKDDPAIRAASEAVMREAKVVPVALDLGMVLLQRAQAMTDPAARRAELEKAEKTFLSVQSLAGETDAYRLNLAQVDYWLGKHDEGRKLFDEVLAAQGRKPDILRGVANLLREVGSESEARPLVEEAFEKETDPAKKSGTAVQRSVISTDVDDNIAWLRRADAEDLSVQAHLAEALARKAMQEGKDDEAVGHLRRSIASNERMAENSTTLNNAALSYLSLFRLTGDRRDYDRAVEKLGRAVALDPSNSVLIVNSAHQILQGALGAIVADAIDLKALKKGGDLDLLPFLYRDRAGRGALEARLRDDPGVARAIALFEKAQLLAPKRSDPYDQMAEVYGYSHDVEALRGLARRLEGVDLDLADETTQALDFYAGKRDEKMRADLAPAVERAEAGYRAAKAGAGGATLAVAAHDLVQAKMIGEVVGVPAAAAEIVALSEEADAASPSSATQLALIKALMLRAGRALEAREPRFADLAARHRRSVDPNRLLVVALADDPSLRSAAADDADLRRALDLLGPFVEANPDEVGAWAWVLLASTRPGEATASAARARLSGEEARLKRTIALRLSPVSVGTALDAAWALRLLGEPGEAAAILKACADRGAPVPALPGG